MRIVSNLPAFPDKLSVPSSRYKVFDCVVWYLVTKVSVRPIGFHLQGSNVFDCVKYRGADKTLARPGKKQTNVSVRMA